VVLHLRTAGALAGVLTTLACAAQLQLPAGGVPERRLTSSDPAGFYPLVAEETDFDDLDSVGVATSGKELRRLWRRMGLTGEAPLVDFASHVVIAFKHRDDGCIDELTALVLTRDAHLVPELSGTHDWCEMLSTSTVHMAAVAREALPRQGFVLEWRPGPDQAASLKTVAFEDRAPVHAAASPEQPLRVTGPSAGIVEVPAPGTCALATLDDGTQVFVVRHHDGTTSVLAVDAPAPSYGLEAVRRTIHWSDDSRRFDASHDEYGTAVFGPRQPPLDRYESEPVLGEPTRLAVGRRVPGIQRRTVAPRGHRDPSTPPPAVLEAYLDLRRRPLPLEEAARLPDGSLVVVDASLIVGGGEPAALCRYADRRKSQPRLCPKGSPVPPQLGDGSAFREILFVFYGPMLVRMRGGQFTEVTRLTVSQSAEAVQHPSR
jgi:hypothetical protein